MNRLRFSIASLITLVGIAATGFAAIRVASPGWAGGVFSLTILAMLTSILGIVHRRGPKRVFWIGFAIFGWTHLVLVFAPWFYNRVGPQLLGAQLFTELYPVVHPASANAGMGGFGGMGGMGGGMGGGFRQLAVGGMGGMGMGGGAAPAPGTFVSASNFLQIGQSLETLLWAFLGGWTATYLSSGRREEARGQTQPGAPDPGREPRPSE
jgi:hypothetical protein